MKSDSRPIELLAPAKDLRTGIEAICHGADAVYIGAAKFGARSAAGNSVEDIARLIDFAHLYGVRVYVTVNTILTDEELPEAAELIRELYRIKTDALLVQDMALLQMNDLPPIPFHASTQVDIRTAERVRFLEKAGFRQVVLARELSLEQIREIRRNTTAALEVFVHGALCVSYSGQCYASQYCFGRSANRGECAQFCRLPFTLTDADGKTIICDKYLLSLKDMNRSACLEQLLDAGVTSLKIEGRLKEESYVKNITAYYRRKLDEIFRHRTEYCRASTGRVEILFAPAPEKSFNRGFTDYFLNGRTADISSVDTPKSMGEPVGVVKEIGRNWFTVAGIASFSNGDGLCFLDGKRRLQGFKVNRAEANKLYPREMPAALRLRTPLYRNFSQVFERQLAQKSAERKIEISIYFSEIPFGYALTLTDSEEVSATVAMAMEKIVAQTPQQESIRTQLTRLGDTPFECTGYHAAVNCFIPASQLNELRRRAVDLLIKNRKINYRQLIVPHAVTCHPFSEKQLTYLSNVLNSRAAGFYRAHGVQSCAFAFEKKVPAAERFPIMFCRHCLKYSLGWCSKMPREKSPYREPFYLLSGDGRRFPLVFDCKQCIMKVMAEP